MMKPPRAEQGPWDAAWVSPRSSPWIFLVPSRDRVSRVPIFLWIWGLGSRCCRRGAACLECMSFLCVSVGKVFGGLLTGRFVIFKCSLEKPGLLDRVYRVEIGEGVEFIYY